MFTKTIAKIMDKSFRKDRCVHTQSDLCWNQFFLTSFSPSEVASIFSLVSSFSNPCDSGSDLYIYIFACVSVQNLCHPLYQTKLDSNLTIHTHITLGHIQKLVFFSKKWTWRLLTPQNRNVMWISGYIYNQVARKGSPYCGVIKTTNKLCLTK